MHTTCILGPGGGFGAAVLAEAAARGHALRTLARRPMTGLPPGTVAVTGDARDPAAVGEAVAGAGTVVFAVNVPYPQWAAVMPAALEACLAALRPGQRLVFPGNVYALPRGAGVPLTEDVPDAPAGPKARLRAALERRLREAAARPDGPAVLVLRGADFFGPTVRNGMVDRIFGAAAADRPLQVIGSGRAPHQLTYVPDMARACLDLLARDLDRFAVVNAPTVAVPSLEALCRMAAEAAGHPGLPVRRLPWWLVRLLGLGSPLLRELVELKPLFEGAVVLDDTRLHRLLPAFAATPLHEAVAATVASYRVAS